MNKHFHYRTGIIFILLMGGFATFAQAQSQPQSQPQGEAGYVIRQEAQETCADKDSGDVCSFVNSAGDSINGSCGYQGGVGGKLICIPIH